MNMPRHFDNSREMSDKEFDKQFEIDDAIQCQAKIKDRFGNKSNCSQEAVLIVTTKTFAPHSQQIITKVKRLCSHHAKIRRHDFNYKIKHCGKRATIFQELITKPE